MEDPTFDVQQWQVKMNSEDGTTEENVTNDAEIEPAIASSLDTEKKTLLRKKRRRQKRKFTRIKRRNQNVISNYAVSVFNPAFSVNNRLKRGAAIVANKNRLKERRKLLENDVAIDRIPSKSAIMNTSRIANRISLQERRKLLEAAIAMEAEDIRIKDRKPAKKTVSTCNNNNTDKFAHLADDELNNLMEPEIVIETQDECFVQYNMESSSISAPEPSTLVHFLSAHSDFDPSITNEKATTPQNVSQKFRHRPHEVRGVSSLTALVKVPVGKILCNFGHVIEQARKLERHTLRCGLGGEMVYHMTLKTGTVYEAIYRCSQPNCAVRMTIASDFYDINAL